MVQGELFIDEKNDLRSQSPSFFSSHKISFSLDKVILLSIALLVLFALTFSFGYERGKRTTEQRIQELTSHVETIPAVPTPPDAVTEPTLIASEKSQDTFIAVVPERTQGATPIANSVKQAVQTEQATPVSEEAVNLQAKSSAQAAALTGKYTIQVATATSKDLAEKEIKKLEKKGHPSFFVQRGRYYEVCVGSFDTVKNAKPILNELKAISLYADAFVRPLS